MEVRLENLSIVRGYKLSPGDCPDVILFDLNGSPSLEYLDGNELCDELDSDLCYLTADVGDADDIRERLAAWLAGPSHRVRWVSEDRQGELTGWEVPHGGVVEAVKAECLREVLATARGNSEEETKILAGTVEATPVEA